MVDMLMKCIKKVRDKNNRIIGYTLQCVDKPDYMKNITPENLKEAIRTNKVTVVNLTLTSNNRLVDASPSFEVSIKNVEKIAKMVFRQLGYTGAIRELKQYDQSSLNTISKYYNTVDKVFYCDEEFAMLNVSLSSNEVLWIAIETPSEDNVCELKCKEPINDKNIKALIEQFARLIKSHIKFN